jgi:hypothetical protein
MLQQHMGAADTPEQRLPASSNQKKVEQGCRHMLLVAALGAALVSYNRDARL